MLFKNFAIGSLGFAIVIALTSAHAQVLETNNSISKNTVNSQSQKIDQDLRNLISRYKLTGSPQSDSPIPNIDSPKAQLGMKLFYSKTLGGDNTTACASCHHPMLGGGDNLSLSIGVDSTKPDLLGENRSMNDFKHTQVPRNAPTTFNVAFWKRVLFHDMRIEKTGKFDIHTPDMPYPEADPLAGENLVQAQARFPITSFEEMRGEYLDSSLNQTLRRALAKRLQKNWLEEFRQGFDQPNGKAEELITEQNYSEAIAAYERSQVFFNNPWKAYIEGDENALSESAKKGAMLFYTDRRNGGAGCATCHSGDFFTDEKAHNTAMLQIGAGKNNGVTGSNDYGCNLVTQKESDKFRFRTPTLLNVEVTGPWGHAGAYTSLESITKHMINPIQAAENYNPKQLKQKNIHVKDVSKNTKEAILSGVDIPLATRNFSNQDVEDIVNFLKALTDPCVKDRACLSKWIPEKDDNDPDGMMLHARDSKTGKLL